MSFARKRQCAAIVSCLLVGACAESGKQQEAAPASVLLQDPNTHIIAGDPGLSVDCRQTIPCRWISADTQFSLTISHADNTATRSRLAINYSIATSHDTEVFVSRADDTLDADGIAHKATGQSLGGGNGGTPQSVAAGTAIQGAYYFDKGTASDSIVQWSVTIIEGGVTRTPAFTAIPVGALNTAQVDCRNALPCVWTTPQSDVTVTLQSLGGISENGYLSTDFTIETSRNMSISLDTGTTAKGVDGTRFEGNTHTLQAQTDFKKVVTEAEAGTPVSGSVDFYRTVGAPDGLQLLSLVVYEEGGGAWWNPEFVNVPVYP